MTEETFDFSGLEMETVPAEADAPDEDGPQRTRQRKKRSDAGMPRGTRAAGGTTTTRRTTDSKLAQELLDPWAKISAAIAFTMPVTSGIMVKRGEKTCDALVAISANHPRMRKALQNVGKVGPGTDLAETVICIVIAMQVDSGKMDPRSPIAAALGITEIHRQMYGDRPPEVVDMEPLNFQPPPPPPDLITDPRHPMYAWQAGGSR